MQARKYFQLLLKKNMRRLFKNRMKALEIHGDESRHVTKFSRAVAARRTLNWAFDSNKKHINTLGGGGANSYFFQCFIL